jgi:hypothetical protein
MFSVIPAVERYGRLLDLSIAFVPGAKASAPCNSTGQVILLAAEAHWRAPDAAVDR